MAAELTIREARPADAEQISEIEKLCFADPWSLEAVRSELEDNPAACYIVAESGGEIAGYAGLWKIIDEGHITNVAVRPEYRGCGIGSAVIEALIEDTLRQGIRHHTLEVRRSNTAARALYERHGFTVEGIRRQYYQKEKEDALIMWRHEETETGA